MNMVLEKLKTSKRHIRKDTEPYLFTWEWAKQIPS
jgi:hypothetical protein